ncbi:glycosaminoglycan xylosylkinase-like [Penaeus chinensis]|uniref:glycosaminoglycan xylosylkinase-like n=1 Tax=Penaeus chinensis TaxID=139456 RepID=UPI001FB657E9|nr:glycosaminoglycan xylosylkinase-like [Penaeus chinensis]
MGVTRKIMIGVFFAVLLSLYFFMTINIMNNATQRNLQSKTLASVASSRNGHEDKVYLQGEVYAVREIHHPRNYHRNRTGLRMLSSVYKHLPEIKAKYSSASSQLMDLITKLKRDIAQRKMTDEPWALADKWATTESLVPEPASGLGDVLAALSTAPITAADVGRGGTQLKLFLILEGRQAVVFRPMSCQMSGVNCCSGGHDIIYDDIYGGPDRPEGEIAAFHLSRLLGLRMTPLTAGRSVSLRRDILPVSTERLSSTFLTGNEGQMCFYGICTFCNKNESVCENFNSLEGSVTMWMPERLVLEEIIHPWHRTYMKNAFAKWENNESFCEIVLQRNHSQKLLHLMDAAVFDFLIQNGDRHHYNSLAGSSDSPVVLLDNGKSFSDAGLDHMDVLAPVLQCCRLRRSMYARLVLLSGGGLSRALRELLGLDPLAPLLADAHLRALDRRLEHVLAALSACSERKGGWHNVLF